MGFGLWLMELVRLMTELFGSCASDAVSLLRKLQMRLYKSQRLCAEIYHLVFGALVVTVLIFRKSPSVRNLDTAVKVPLLLGVLAYWSIFALTVFAWRF